VPPPQPSGEEVGEYAPRGGHHTSPAGGDWCDGASHTPRSDRRMPQHHTRGHYVRRHLLHLRSLDVLALHCTQRPGTCWSSVREVVDPSCHCPHETPSDLHRVGNRACHHLAGAESTRVPLWATHWVGWTAW
jgi:hypothetical protein